jgi:hypothetical protein
MKEKIRSLSDDQILGSDLAEWISYYFDLYKIQPISLFLEHANPKLEEVKIEKYNEFAYFDPYRPKKILIDGYKISYNIPFDGDKDLLYVRPSIYSISAFIVDKIITGRGDELGQIVFSLDFPKSDSNKFIEGFASTALSEGFSNYEKTIERINQDVNSHNERLTTIASSELQARKKKAEDFVQMGKVLNIPLKLNPNAPSTTPVILKRAIPKTPQMPTTRPRDKEYAISNDDYTKIRQIISLAGTSMEKSARTFAKLEEEELRDNINATLNTHFQGTATGETFSKVGKTDIHIPFENKSAFIAECKIWHGEKQLQNALEQLFSYTTWRDVRTSLVIFNKDNKDFKKMLNTIQTFLNNNPICRHNVATSANEWACKFVKSEDSTDLIEVQIIVFDLYIPTT